MIGRLLRALGVVPPSREGPAPPRRRPADGALKKTAPRDDVCGGRTGKGHVISLTRLDGTTLVVNSDLIATVESTPDTVVTLLGGTHVMVKESVDDVVGAVVAFRRRLLAPDGPELLRREAPADPPAEAEAEAEASEAAGESE